MSLFSFFTTTYASSIKITTTQNIFLLLQSVEGKKRRGREGEERSREKDWRKYCHKESERENEKIHKTNFYERESKSLSKSRVKSIETSTFNALWHNTIFFLLFLPKPRNLFSTQTASKSQKKMWNYMEVEERVSERVRGIRLYFLRWEKGKKENWF